MQEEYQDTFSDMAEQLEKVKEASGRKSVESRRGRMSWQ
jgi:hypothetical protein